MKFIIVLFTLAALCVAVEQAKTLKQTSDADGSFNFEYAKGPDTVTDEASDKTDGVQKRFSYTTPEGRQIEIVYETDPNDKEQKESSDSPPPYVLRALEYIKTHPPKEE